MRTAHAVVVVGYQAGDGSRDVNETGVQTFSLFFQAEDGIRDYKVTGVQTCALLFQAEDGIRDYKVTGVQTCALPICSIASNYEIQNSVVDIGDGTADWLARFVYQVNWRRYYISQMVGYDRRGGIAPDEIGRASCRERV